MAILKDPKSTAFEITEGMMILTFNDLMGMSYYSLRELLQILITSKQNIRYPSNGHNGNDVTEETDFKLQRIDHALSVMNDYLNENYRL